MVGRMAGNLTRAQARRRAQLLTVHSYAVELDLTGGPDRFDSSTLINFDCAEPGASTFCDLYGAEPREMLLNGRPLDATRYDPAEGRLMLPELAARNTLRVVASCAYSRSGQGLHRFTDPTDDQVYLHTQFATADAQRVFACFDQPDLKASFQLTVTAPEHWEVASNNPAASVGAAPRSGAARQWLFTPTPPLPSYLVAVVAGSWHVVGDTYQGSNGQRVPLRLLCRASLAPHLDAAELFDTTTRGLDYFQRAFAVPFPFAKYDQVFVPEHTFGAMENAGCVTLRESHVFRSKVTDAEHETRAVTMLHELAHMWFGDLVTMRWWDDAWLNESFASYAATLALSAATRWRDGWVTFVEQRQARAFHADQLPSTHPVASDIADVSAMEVNFDGITYDKGAAALRQLAAAVGESNFLAGVHTYFTRHAWGNTTLADLLTALREASGVDLDGWADDWLRTCGLNTLRPEFDTDDAGRFTAFAIAQRAPAAHPTLRRHHVAIGLYDRTEHGIVRRDRIETTVAGRRVDIPELRGVRRPDLLLVNDDALTFAKMHLDEASLRTVLTGVDRIVAPMPQTVCLAVAWEMTRDAELPARDYLTLAGHAAPAVASATVRHDLLDHQGHAALYFTDPAWRATGVPATAATLLAMARAQLPGSESQLAFAAAFAGLAGAPDQLELLAALLRGTADSLPGLVVDADLRWRLLYGLAAGGHLAGDADAIDAEARRDATAEGLRRAAGCRAALPDTEAKAAAWALVGRGGLSTAMLTAILTGFTDPRHDKLTAPYLPAYFALLDDVVERWPNELTMRLATRGYPAGATSASVLDATDAWLTGAVAARTPWLRRLVLDRRDDLSRALRAQTRDAAAD
jgi:aminopeptidase N